MAGVTFGEKFDSTIRGALAFRQVPIGQLRVWGTVCHKHYPLGKLFVNNL